jgi:CHAT domain-containing protein/Flp pilus assembly protein TadD
LLAGCNHAPDFNSKFDEAQLKYRQGYTEAAMQVIDSLYRKSENDPVWHWKFRILKAQALLRKGQTEQAAFLLGSEPPAIVPAEIRVRRQTIQAQAFCLLGKTTEAQSLLDDVDHSIRAEDRTLAAGMAYVRAKCADQDDLVLQYSQQAAELAHGVDPFTEANALIVTSYILLKMERYDESVDIINMAIPLTDYPLIKELAYGNLGYSYSQLGDYRRAIDSSREAARLAAKIGFLHDQEKWLLDEGRAYVSLFEFQDGEAALNQSLEIAGRLHDQEISSYCLNNLLIMELTTGNLNRAEEYWKQEVSLQKSASSDPLVVLDHAKIVFAKKDYPTAETLFESILSMPGINAALRSIVQEALAVTLWTEGKIDRANQTFRAGIKSAEQAVAEYPAYRLSVLDENPFFDGYIRFLIAQQKPDQALQLAEHARVLAEEPNGNTNNFTVAAVKARLRHSKQIILRYAVTNDETILWIITPSNFQAFHLPPHREIDQEMEAYNKEIQEHRDTQNSQVGQKLYATLIQPAEKFIPRGSHVIIVPSKVLTRFNFETLVVPGPSPHYWIEDVEVQVANSVASVLKPERRQDNPSRGMLLVGAPVLASSEFPVLQHAHDEVERIEKHFPSAQPRLINASFTSKSATPATYLKNHPGDYRYIHFVTHGTASEKVPMESAIILSPDADNSYKLYARDIVKTPLHADLVTISACYGAGIRWYQSAGLVGLSWAFLHAGAHQVVAGLWEIDDAATPEFMDHFYAEVQKGKTAAAALHSAKLAMLHSNTVYQHPFYWGSLQLYVGS